MKKAFLYQVLILIILAALFAGCSSSDSDTVTTKKNNNGGAAGLAITGAVQDGPISGARVYLYSRTTGEILNLCGSTLGGPCEAETDANGEFTMRIDPDADLDDIMVVAMGGEDVETGVNFDGLELKAPLEMFEGTEVSVTPATTLISLRLEAGDALADVKTRVAQWLGVSEEDLDNLPTEDPDMMQRTLFLTQLILSRLSNGADDAFGELSENGITGLNNLFGADGSLNETGLADILSGEEALMAAYFYQILSASADPEEAFKEMELSLAITRAIIQLQDAGESFADFDIESADIATYWSNVRLLAQAILTAGGDDGIPLDGMVPMLLARYVIDDLSLDEMADFLVSEADFLSLIAGVSSDENIAEIASDSTEYNVEVKLTASEYLGDDNQKRLEYYYGSDVSHLYEAAQVVRHVRDDEVNDQVMVEVLSGTADAGLFNDAKDIVLTNVWQSEYRGDGWRRLALRQIEHGYTADALESLDKAYYYYKRVINAKGESNIGNSDTTNLQGICNGYRKAGDNDAALGVLDYMETIAQNENTITTWGRMAVGARNVAIDMIEAGDYGSARPIIETLYGYTQNYPPNEKSGKQYYKARVYYMSETAELYAAIGDTDKVLAVVNAAEALRANDGIENLTAGETWVYVPYMVLSLYQAGHEQEAYDLALSIPDTYQNYAGSTKSAASYQQTCYKSMAANKAANGSVNEALDIVDNKIDAGRDQIEALTYYASNDATPYVGLALIEAGNTVSATAVLEKAAGLLDGLTESTDYYKWLYKVHRGYGKVGDLYHRNGQDFEALSQLSKGKAYADSGIASVEYRVDSYCSLAQVYFDMGETATADSLMDSAMALIDANASAADPDDAADIYRSIVIQMLAMGYRDAALPALQSAAEQADAIFTGATAEDDHDDAIDDEVGQLIYIAGYYVDAGFYDTAATILDAALITAYEFYNTTDKYDAIVDIVEAYAAAKDFDSALNAANSIPYTSDRNEALLIIAQTMSEADDFPDTAVATVDTDGDGKPNFFHPLATAQEITDSGSELDDDSDGDGIGDGADARPLFAG